jgi:hypothetical protein
MVTVCAWCQKYMGSKEPFQNPGVSHGICSACVERQSLAYTPVLVVSPSRAGTVPLLSTLLSGAPDVEIVVDRRSGERRHDIRAGYGNGGGNGNGRRQLTGMERRVGDRRRESALYLV